MSLSDAVAKKMPIIFILWAHWTWKITSWQLTAL